MPFASSIGPGRPAHFCPLRSTLLAATAPLSLRMALLLPSDHQQDAVGALKQQISTSEIACLSCGVSSQWVLPRTLEDWRVYWFWCQVLANFTDLCLRCNLCSKVSPHPTFAPPGKNCLCLARVFVSRASQIEISLSLVFCAVDRWGTSPCCCLL